MKIKRILLVEDNHEDLESLSCILEDCGYEIVQTRSGSQAFTALQKGGKFDLVISDIEMAGGDGLQLLQNMRTSRELRSIPALLCTGWKDKSTVIAALNAGAQGYLTKPYGLETLLTKTNDVIEKGLGTVMVASDSEALLKVVSMFIGREGFRVARVKSVKELSSIEDLLDTHDVRAALIDTTSHWTSSVEMRAVAVKKFAGTKVILITNKFGDLSRSEWKVTDADGWICQPLYGVALADLLFSLLFKCCVLQVE